MVDTLYAGTEELRAMFDIKDTLDDDLLELAVNAASRWIDGECQRRFYLDDTTSARYYFAGTGEDLEVDDFDPGTAITVAIGETFATTLTLNAGYFPVPLNAAVLDRPYTALRRISNCWPATSTGKPTVRVTAKWGWPSVPDGIKQACLIQAADVFKQKDNPFGVAGFGDFGAVRIRANAAVESLLFDYRLRKTLVA